MGALVEERVHRAVHVAHRPRDEDARADHRHATSEINDLQIEIDDRCLKLLALQQPAGGGPAPHHLGHEDQRRPRAHRRPGGQHRGERARAAAAAAAQAAHRHPAHGRDRGEDDPGRARRLRAARTPSWRATCCGATTRWTQLKDQVFRELLTYMMADPGTIQRALGLILISRNLERIADHATNIAEDVIFLVGGEGRAPPPTAGGEADEGRARRAPGGRRAGRRRRRRTPAGACC